MAMGSWLRYVIGILLSLDVLRLYVTRGGPELTTAILAIAFLGLAVLYLVRRF